ncbi:GH25 family lysozyme [Shigella boydii]
MRDNGIRLQFAFIKATEGEKLVDPYFSRNCQPKAGKWPAARRIDHFSRPDRSPVQARIHLENGGFLTRRFPCMDVEERGKLSQKNYESGKSVAKNGRKKYGKSDYSTSGSADHTNLAGLFQ